MSVVRDVIYVFSFLAGVATSVGVWALFRALRRWEEGEPVHLPTTDPDRKWLGELGIKW
jgi:hypothetical protein